MLYFLKSCRRQLYRPQHYRSNCALRAPGGAVMTAPLLTQRRLERYFLGSAGGGGMVTLSVSMRIFHKSPSRTSVVDQ